MADLMLILFVMSHLSIESLKLLIQGIFYVVFQVLDLILALLHVIHLSHFHFHEHHLTMEAGCVNLEEENEASVALAEKRQVHEK